LCERFVCGPPSVCNHANGSERAFTPFYDSEWARVFYERNVWPSSLVPALQPCMEAAYAALEPAAHACLQCLAAALDKPHDCFDALVSANAAAAHPTAPLRHHSRLQLNNYPSQLAPPRGAARARHEPPIRARRHLDTSMVTVLARQDHHHTAPGLTSSFVEGVLKAGQSGALEVQLPDGSWSCVPTGPGQLTVFTGYAAVARKQTCLFTRCVYLTCLLLLLLLLASLHVHVC
jgi:isopenicillin N synthase-like dioxygenase